MLAILLVGLIAACGAAPHFPHGSPPFHLPSPDGPHFHRHRHFDPFASEIFDTRQFWAEIANEMRQLDTVLAEFYQKFPAVSSTQGIQGNEYIITIPLSGFVEKEIVVKAREGVLMVQAVHKMESGGERSYLDIKTLPTYVNMTGSWTFEKDVLKIVFPLKSDMKTEDADVTEAPSVEHSREEIAPNGEDADSDAEVNTNTHTDADVGAGDREKELITNEIPRNTVEATTYAVDLKDEFEFVPVRY